MAQTLNPKPQTLTSQKSTLYGRREPLIGRKIGGWGWGNRFVSCRACVRAYARCAWSSEILSESKSPPFPFPFQVAGLSLFPHESICSLFPPSESRWVPVSQR